MAPAFPAASDVASDNGKAKKNSPSKAKDVEEWDKDEKKSPKKAPEPASKRRKSVATEDSDSDAGASASAAKKRGRKSSVKAADNEEDPEPRKTGEKKTLASASASGGAAASANEAPENIEIGDMTEHMHAPTWEHLIKMIDTVERVEEQLVVYFMLNTNEHVKEDSELLQFYGKNLRWKESSD
ncbi:hypothetical protein B0H17DRAFT_1190218 [Mycena rosella]|uniref:Uncharacterized protein n=1 Tax=Mycena rosella TaxID=1033263 RepID=A0AAD7H2M1_MYCRO|nr:hypothetical protein B0H17DRAFT_1190218 [Mycena rosella]